MRKNETNNVKALLSKLGSVNLHIINCEEDFLSALAGIEDPEAKRRAVGDTFIKVQERETAKLGIPDAFLTQGTIAPDVIESGNEGNASLIKSHHNVGTPLVQAKKQAGKLIEPFDKLFKTDVRALGAALGLPEDTVKRHPFPGPGLAVRILGEVTREKCDILREADAIYIDELKKRNLYNEIWQAFAVLTNLRSVGISGGKRSYGRVLALRAITSSDAMTAEVYPFNLKDLFEISALITTNVKDISRVTYDISSKPPATIEWE